MKYAVIIPARYQSSRLPGKPLIDLNGVPMIVRTYRQCIKACSPDLVYVATDDYRIKELCESYNISVLMTSDQCMTGTDRIAECTKQLDADLYINVQGDEPVIDPDDISRIIEEAVKYPEDILNGYCEITDEDLFRSPGIPKVVMRPDGRLLYMSRAAIPATKSLAFDTAWRQICLYAFPRKALEEFYSKKTKTLLESMEDIEILRFLEMGYEVRMVELSDSSIAIDTEDDVRRVLERLEQEGRRRDV